MQYFAQTLCPRIGGFLMNLDGHGGTPQVNLTVSAVLALLTALLTIFFFPETVHESRQSKSATSEPDPEVGTNKDTESRKWTSKFAQSFSETVSGVGVFNIIFLSISICFAATGIKAIDWYALVQYPVVKPSLHWTFPQASSVVALEGFLMLIHFSILLPALNRLAVSYLGSTTAAHFTIMLCSAILLTLGSLVMGISSTSITFISGVVVYLFGEGLPTATQAYIVSLTDKAKVARVISTLSMASIFGKLTGSILFPKVLAWGLDSHIDILVGLPMFVSAGMFVASASCVAIVGLRLQRAKSRDAASDGS